MTNYVLFLDDERDPPKPEQWFGAEIVHAKTPPEFVKAIKERGAPFAVLFDWHLGSGWPDGLELAKWLIEYDREHDVLEEGVMYDSHSSNRDRARDIVRLLSDYLATKYHAGDRTSARQAERLSRREAGVGGRATRPVSPREGRLPFPR